MRRFGLRWLIASTAALTLLVALAAPAGAHPLGNFTVNRYARVEVSAGLARIHYVLDMAEIPAFQVRDRLEADPAAFIEDEIASIIEGFTLEVDGRPIELAAIDQQLTQPDGQGGLTTLRLVVLLEGALPEGPGDEVKSATVRDTNGGQRIGWREIVVVADGDAEIVQSSVEAEDLTDELRSYPKDRLASPLALREAAFTFTAGTQQVGPGALDTTAATLPGDRFTDLLDRRDITPLVLLGMLAVAALVGVGHALAPGHGKTVMAAYLIGTRGRPVDAVLLGVIVSAMHTGSVLLLGFALFRVDQSFALERIYPILTLVSGVGVLLVGGWLVGARLRSLRGRSASEHEHHHGDRELVTVGHHHGPGVHATGDDPSHDHPADQGVGHQHGPGGHSHGLPQDVAPLSRRGLLLLATAGGVVPSPSAVIVLVSAFTLGRAGLGLALVAAFSVGLAATLTAVGLALVLGSRAFGDRLSGRLVRAFPLLGAAALVVLGLVLSVRGLSGL